MMRAGGMGRVGWTLLASAAVWVAREVALAEPPCSRARLRIRAGAWLTLTGEVGSTYRIECADTLDNPVWTLITNLVLPFSPCEWCDVEASEVPQRFYRLFTTAVIQRQPETRMVLIGTTAAFTVAASAGCQAVRYAWRRNGTNLVEDGNLAGTTNATLIISNAQVADAAVYSVLVTTEGGVQLSAPALLLVEHPDTGVPYGLATWPEDRGYHRARLLAAQAADVAWVRIPWRRRDPRPDLKDVVIYAAGSDLRVTNVLRVNIGQEFGDLMFQPISGAGEYHAYYLPRRLLGIWYSPTTVYSAPTNTADPRWLAAVEPLAQRIANGQTNGLAAAGVAEFQARSEFHRFDPMEVVATRAETLALLETNAARPYLLFPEDRRFPIRMLDALPLRWVRAGPREALAGRACRGEFYSFQIGLYASAQPVDNVTVRFRDLLAEGGGVIPASALRCFNVGGTNWLGQPVRKTVNVPAGVVQPLWFGVAVPLAASPATYRGTLKIRADNAPATDLELSVTVSDDVLLDSGDAEPWKHSRLRWLDSTLGLDKEVTPPYSPVEESEGTLRIFGRHVHVAEGGLLEAMSSSFSRSVDALVAPPQEMLAGPMRFVVKTNGAPLLLRPEPPVFTRRAPGVIAWKATNTSDLVELRCAGRMECDGYINYRLTLRARADVDVDDLRLVIPLRRGIATYMMGLGRKGGLRPAQWHWDWSGFGADNQVWLGDVHAGLNIKLKHVEDRWDVPWRYIAYQDWANSGQGGCSVSEVGANTVAFRAFTGPRSIAAGEELHFNFGMLMTPVKRLNKDHWIWRYYHALPVPAVPRAAQAGATIVNIHSGGTLNPYINYPFLLPDALDSYGAQAHEAGLKFKLYYTARELSNHALEFWALRSLGHEVLADGLGDARGPVTGGSWLVEHVLSHYAPAWHQPLEAGDYEEAVETTGLSRWHNYYLEGLSFLLRTRGLDGLYLDGIGYDREIMKRVRKTLLRGRPDALLDFHSGNSLVMGSGSPACQYAEHFPYLDSLWFGELFDYNETPDYWLVEMSGIPFGLFGEMLQDGGNPWRGMVYGMSCRYYAGCDPSPLWRFWDQFGIRDARMIGYWDPACPVRTSDTNVLATAYVATGKTLIALGNWCTNSLSVRLDIDGASLGLDLAQAHLVAPGIAGFQGDAVFHPRDVIPVAPAQGWLLVLTTDPAF